MYIIYIYIRNVHNQDLTLGISTHGIWSSNFTSHLLPHPDSLHYFDTAMGVSSSITIWLIANLFDELIASAFQNWKLHCISVNRGIHHVTIYMIKAATHLVMEALPFSYTHGQEKCSEVAEPASQHCNAALITPPSPPMDTSAHKSCLILYQYVPCTSYIKLTPKKIYKTR